ncbi:putative uncharacterized protein DDB_G0282133 [Hydra vulgaris]|uniref:OTU domain-containing protein n=1 Tax=Hydra vulgaris TaxID=6087 RepID=A0ABM4CSF9_HYDVU
MRKSIAEKFGVVSKHNVAFGNINLTLCPLGVHRVKGDGNCFFRAVSFIITGNEDDHESIRGKIVNHMCNEIQDEMTGYLNMPIRAHICKTKMLENATWATDAEIIGCASFMQVDIQVYGKNGAKTKWMIYPCSLRLNKLSDYSIFLDNSTGIHFDVEILKLLSNAISNINQDYQPVRLTLRERLALKAKTVELEIIETQKERKSLASNNTNDIGNSVKDYQNDKSVNDRNYDNKTQNAQNPKNDENIEGRSLSIDLKESEPQILKTKSNRNSKNINETLFKDKQLENSLNSSNNHEDIFLKTKQNNEQIIQLNENEKGRKPRENKKELNIKERANKGKIRGEKKAEEVCENKEGIVIEDNVIKGDVINNNEAKISKNEEVNNIIKEENFVVESNKDCKDHKHADKIKVSEDVKEILSSDCKETVVSDHKVAIEKKVSETLKNKNVFQTKKESGIESWARPKSELIKNDFGRVEPKRPISVVQNSIERKPLSDSKNRWSADIKKSQPFADGKLNQVAKFENPQPGKFFNKLENNKLDNTNKTNSTVEVVKPCEISKSHEVTKSHEITKSVEITNSLEITKSIEVTKSQEVTKTIDVSSSTDLTKSQEVTKSYKVTESVEVNKSRNAAGQEVENITKHIDFSVTKTIEPNIDAITSNNTDEQSLDEPDSNNNIITYNNSNLNSKNNGKNEESKYLKEKNEKLKDDKKIPGVVLKTISKANIFKKGEETGSKNKIELEKKEPNKFDCLKSKISHEKEKMEKKLTGNKIGDLQQNKLQSNVNNKAFGDLTRNSSNVNQDKKNPSDAFQSKSSNNHTNTNNMDNKSKTSAESKSSFSLTNDVSICLKTSTGSTICLTANSNDQAAVLAPNAMKENKLLFPLRVLHHIIKKYRSALQLEFNLNILRTVQIARAKIDIEKVF